MKTNNCSLSALEESKRKNGICYSDTIINKFITDVMHEKTTDNIIENVAIINKYMKNKYGCKDQLCWPKYEKYFGDEAKKKLLPKARWTKKNRLISNIDISNVMKQYEDYNKNFKYLGDFDHDVVIIDKDRDELLKRLEESKDYGYRAIVVSLWGEEWKHLNHWTIIWLDSKQNLILFYDSDAGVKTRYEIAPLIDMLHKNTEGLYKLYRYSLVMTQYDYEHCGLFTIHFIHKLLIDGYTFDKYINELLNEIDNGKETYYEYIMSLRKKYFIIE